MENDGVGLTTALLREAVLCFAFLSEGNRRLAIEIASTGQSTGEIAHGRERSESTIKNRISDIYRQLGISTESFGDPRVVLVRVVWACSRSCVDGKRRVRTKSGDWEL